MAGGTEIGANINPSSTSGAVDSGAVGVDIRGGGNYGGASYGPGSVVFGPANTPGIGWGPLVVVGLLVFGVWWFFIRKEK